MILLRRAFEPGRGRWTFPGGFVDETYVEWERGYKWETHERWEEALGRAEFRRLLRAGEFKESVPRAIERMHRIMTGEL